MTMGKCESNLDFQCVKYCYKNIAEKVQPFGVFFKNQRLKFLTMKTGLQKEMTSIKVSVKNIWHVVVACSMFIKTIFIKYECARYCNVK